jgi:RHS repeat-associated protein
MTKVLLTPRYHYDAFNRMDSAAGTSYYVNPEGQRCKSGAAGTSYFAPDSSNAMLSEYSGGWIDYVWLNGRLVGRVAGGQFYAIHSDQVGLPEAVTNESKAIVWRAQNFAFNQKVVTSGITFNLGFPGQYYDAETGLWNNGFRDYSSMLGRYLQSDPIGLEGGINTYAYVDGDPLNWTDPQGLQSMFIGGAAIDQPMFSDLSDCAQNAFANGLAQVVPGLGTALTFAGKSLTPYGNGPLISDEEPSAADYMATSLSSAAGAATGNFGEMAATSYIDGIYRNLSAGNKAARRSDRFANQTIWRGGRSALKSVKTLLGPASAVMALMNTVGDLKKCDCKN